MQKLIQMVGGLLLDRMVNLKLNLIKINLGILDHQYVDEESSWNIPMRIIQNGNFSEVVIILTKPEQLSDFQFDQRVSKINQVVISMKKILESNT